MKTETPSLKKRRIRVTIPRGLQSFALSSGAFALSVAVFFGTWRVFYNLGQDPFRDHAPWSDVVVYLCVEIGVNSLAFWVWDRMTARFKEPAK